MTNAPRSTIAQLVYAQEPALNFAHLVRELDQALERCPAAARSLTWDYDDLAIFDLDGTRILISLADAPSQGYATCITLSVGATDATTPLSPLTRRHEALCRLISDRLQSRHPVAAILWHQSALPVTTEMVDSLLEILPNRGDLEHLHCPATHAPRVPLFGGQSPANDRPDLPQTDQDRLRNVRHALYAPVIDNAPSVPLRLAIHSMNTTLIMVSLPIGAALMTYSVLRGGDLRNTTRALVLTGTLYALRQTTLGQQIATSLS